MRGAIELALAHGWPDEAVDELECFLADHNMEAALRLARTEDMPEPARAQLQELITTGERDG